MYHYPSKLLKKLVNLELHVSRLKNSDSNLCANRHIQEIINISAQASELVDLYLTSNYGRVDAKEGV